MGRIEINNMTGGLNTAEPTKIKDNEFSVLQNMFYNSDFRLQSRRGIREFGNQIGNKPVTSLFSFQNDTTGVSYLVATAGTSLYQYNSGTGNFDEVKTDLSEFEADGVTRTRWSFAVYLNKIYMCNGVDSYAQYDPATQSYTEYTAEPKVRQLAFLGDAIYGGGADDLPNTLYYTNAGAVDGSDLNANSLVVGGDESGRINALNELQTQVQVFKDFKVYSVAGDGSQALATDVESGGFSDRALKRVSNALLNLSERGIDTVSARNGVGNTQAIQSKPLSDNVRDIFAKIQNKNRKFSAGEYILPLTNYYITVDTTNDSLPETTLVYSTLTNGWSEYTYPALNDYTQYIDEQGNRRYLTASANTGIVYEIETGFSDVGVPIPVKLRTKKHDFNKPTILKTFQYVDVVGFKTEGDSIDCNIYIEGEIAGGATITDDYISSRGQSLHIGTSPIGQNVIGGGVDTGSDIELLPFWVRIPLYNTGFNIEIELESDSSSLAWTLEKLALYKDDEAVELFTYENIA